MKKIRVYKGSSWKSAFVDDEDYDRVMKYRWTLWLHPRSDRIFYAMRRGGKSNVSMHRFVMQTKSKKYIDHINSNGLDNQKRNLRLCTPAQNVASSRMNRSNTSGYKGVCWYKLENRWGARIGRAGAPGYFLGFFDNPKDGARAYNNEARKRYGRFAYQNKI